MSRACLFSTDHFDEVILIDENKKLPNVRFTPERTCRYLPDVPNIAFDDDDNEIETGEAHPDGCSYSCSECGFMMVSDGWFSETKGRYGGWDYDPMFSYCPNCGAKVM